MNEEIVIGPSDIPDDVIKFINRFDNYDESMLSLIPYYTLLHSCPLRSKDEAILFFLISIVSPHIPDNFIIIELASHKIFKLSIDLEKIAFDKDMSVYELKEHFKDKLSQSIRRRKRTQY